MAEIPYPKIKYQGADVPPGPYNAQYPGFIYRKVADPDEEKALEGDWHDTPADAIKAHGARKGKTDEGGAAHHAPEPAKRTEEWPTESEKRKR